VREAGWRFRRSTVPCRRSPRGRGRWWRAPPRRFGTITAGRRIARGYRRILWPGSPRGSNSTPLPGRPLPCRTAIWLSSIRWISYCEHAGLSTTPCAGRSSFECYNANSDKPGNKCDLDGL
jgi:hypothetical protein